jgi:RNA polymerase sigma-70 factor (ECF subfamily)
VIVPVNATAASTLLVNLVPRVRNLVRFLVREDEDTDDISQEALVAILRGLGSYRAEGTLQAWANRIVVRSTYAFIRKRRNALASGGTPGIDGRGPEVAVLSDEYLARRRAAALLDRLPQAQRDALVLHYVLEMSVPEIATELSVPAETIRSRLRLARSRLRSGF